MRPDELHTFYEDFVATLRERGVVCAITSGLACVHYGIAETTKDCDLLCHADSFDELLKLLEATSIQGQTCHYRGAISPPLDRRWHGGGWTSHFEWNRGPNAITLDVFGQAVRQSAPWETELSGLYAGMNVVAEMKRTDRDKDWPFITSLGTHMLRARDPRGWLHIYDTDSLIALQEESEIPTELITVRPVLQLAVERESRLRQALLAERNYWQELDRFRIRIYRAALRPYMLSVSRAGQDGTLLEQHKRRVACAEATLPKNPILDHGVERLLGEARQATASLVQQDLLRWLPDAHVHFRYLEK